MPIKWDELSSEAQERILKEHPDVAPAPQPPPRRRRPKYPVFDAFNPRDVAALDAWVEATKNRRRPMGPAVKVLILIVAAYAIVALFYAFYGG